MEFLLVYLPNFTKLGDITQQSSKLFMASLDVDSLFTNVPLDETIEICVNELFKSSQTVSGLNKQQVLEMLSLTTKENVILFDEKYYSQIDGVAMGSPLGPTFANIFLCHHETTWLKNCPKAFKNQCIIKDTLMIFLCCLKNRNKFRDLLII